jgi:hypothetical protein
MVDRPNADSRFLYRPARPCHFLARQTLDPSRCYSGSRLS